MHKILHFCAMGLNDSKYTADANAFALANDQTSEIKKSSSMIDLPTELLLRIVECQHLTLDDKLQLRLTHPRLRDAVSPRIFQTFQLVVGSSERATFHKQGNKCEIVVANCRIGQAFKHNRAPKRLTALCTEPSLAWLRAQITECRLTILRSRGYGPLVEKNTGLNQLFGVLEQQSATGFLKSFPNLRHFFLRIHGTKCGISGAFLAAIKEIYHSMPWSRLAADVVGINIDAELDLPGINANSLMMLPGPLRSLKLKERVFWDADHWAVLFGLLHSPWNLEELELAGPGYTSIDLRTVLARMCAYVERKKYNQAPVKLRRLAVGNSGPLNHPQPVDGDVRHFSLAFLKNLKELEMYKVTPRAEWFPWASASQAGIKLQAITTDWVDDEFLDYLASLGRNTLTSVVLRLSRRFLANLREESDRAVASVFWNILRNHQSSTEELCVVVSSVEIDRAIWMPHVNKDAQMAFSANSAAFLTPKLSFTRLKRLQMYSYYEENGLTRALPSVEIVRLFEESKVFEKLTLDVHVLRIYSFAFPFVSEAVKQIMYHALKASKRWNNRLQDEQGRTVAEAFWIELRGACSLSSYGYRLHVKSKGDI